MTNLELINAIAPDVLKVLANKRFFELLDDQMLPIEPTRTRPSCDGTYAISIAILRQSGFEPDEIAEITEVLASRGGHCDCEILFNVAEESRLKSEYWQTRQSMPT